MDRVGGDYYNVLKMMKDRLGASPLPIVIPLVVAKCLRELLITFDESDFI